MSTVSAAVAGPAELLKTEEAISFVKDTFARELARQLHLTKISAPLAVLDGTGINDDLNGVERPVAFPVKALHEQRAVVVHSLAKWKRLRLAQLGIPAGRGLLTDMRALRPDEDYSPIHSIYVDQWDWEQHLRPEQRTIPVLQATVRRIYEACKLRADLVVDAPGQPYTIIDFKTTLARDYEHFVAQCSVYDYDRQAAFYLDALHAERFLLVGVQKQPPHHVFVFEVPPYMLAEGRAKYLRLLRLLQAPTHTDPAVQAVMTNLSPPDPDEDAA